MDNKLNKRGANFIKARGKIISIGRDSFGHNNIVLLIIRATVNRPLKLSFALESGLPVDVELNDYVNVEGYVKAYNDGVKEDGRDNYIQYLVASKVEKDVPELQKIYNTDEGFAHEDSFVRVCLAGELIYKNHNKDAGWINLTVKVPSINDDQRDDYTVAVQYSENMRVNDVDAVVGDNVAMVTFMSSKTKFKNDVPLYFENFIVDDMFVVKDKEELDEEIKEDADKLKSGVKEKANDFFDALKN